MGLLDNMMKVSKSDEVSKQEALNKIYLEIIRAHPDLLPEEFVYSKNNSNSRIFHGMTEEEQLLTVANLLIDLDNYGSDRLSRFLEEIYGESN